MPDGGSGVSAELQYVLLLFGLFGLFVLPRFPQRYRIPSAISSLGYAAVIEWINAAVARPEDWAGQPPRFAPPR